VLQIKDLGVTSRVRVAAARLKVALFSVGCKESASVASAGLSRGTFGDGEQGRGRRCEPARTGSRCFAAERIPDVSTRLTCG
jgi:hypothetical protein